MLTSSITTITAFQKVRREAEHLRVTQYPNMLGSSRTIRIVPCQQVGEYRRYPKKSGIEETIKHYGTCPGKSVLENGKVDDIVYSLVHRNVSCYVTSRTKY